MIEEYYTYFWEVPNGMGGSFCNLSEAFSGEYSDLWLEFTTTTVFGGGVSFSGINAILNTFDPGNTLPRCPVGFRTLMDEEEQIMELNSLVVITSDDLTGLGDPIYTARCMWVGLIVQQMYRLKLALQANKLTQFGRRGRPRIT